MRVPIAVYSGASTSEPLACSAATATRTGPHAVFIISRYSSGRSRPSLSTARLITWKSTSMSRTFSTSRIHRDVIQHHGHSGSNQKPATDFSGIDESSRSGVVEQTSVGATTRRAQLFQTFIQACCQCDKGEPLLHE